MGKPNRTLNPLESIEFTIAFSSRDMATDKRDAWIYGIVLGWDDEKTFEEFKEKFGWSDAAVKRLKKLHENYTVMAKQSKKQFKEEFKEG